MVKLPPILDIGGILISSDLLTEEFCCDLAVCKGACCIEGDAGAPVTLEEIGEIENCVDVVWDDLSAQAQSVIVRQGVAYTDQEGDLVTSIVGGKDCVFTYYGDIEDWNTHLPIKNCCLCAMVMAYRNGKTRVCKTVICAMYPIREETIREGLIGLNYNRWAVCKMAIAKGIQENLRLYQFLREPLIRRFGEAWYQELLEMVEELKRQNYL